MLVAVDVGNSRIKSVLFAHGQIVARHNTATDPCMAPSDLARFLRATTQGRPQQPALHMAFTSVVPRVGPNLIEAARQVGFRTIIEIAYNLDLGLDVAVRSPETIGPDRIANAVGAVSLLGAPVAAVDFGTAITTTVVTADRRIIGGSIGPGVRTAARALAAFTGRLPEVTALDESRLPEPIGNDTHSAIKSGLIYGAIGAVRELLGRISEAIGAPVPAIATGGLGPFLAPHCGIRHVDTDLTFRGIHQIAIRVGIEAES